MSERDLPQNAELPHARRSVSVVGGDSVGTQQVDDELVDRRQLLHELPRVLAGEAALVDHRLELLVRLGPQHLETGAIHKVR